MVKLGRAITQQFPDAVKFTGAKDFTFDKIHQPNFNTLLFYDARVNGLKTGHVEEALKTLDEAIQVSPALRFQARNDSDFQNLAEDPRFTELLYPDTSADAAPEPEKWHY